jgi:hypothetical protein
VTGASTWVCAMALALVAFLAPEAAPASAAPYSSHSQIYSCCTGPAAADAMFSEAKQSGAAYIRLDVDMQTVFRDGPNAPDWAELDSLAALSRRYGLPILGTVLGAPDPARSCTAAPADRDRVCPPADPGEWGSEAGQVAARYAGTIDHLEIWNEPDGAWAFAGTPADYAHLLSSAYGWIKALAPGASVVLGGTMNPDAPGTAWLDQVFRTPGANAAWRFDIASIHLRDGIPTMIGQMAARAAFLRGWGRFVPMWVTEHGYPGDPAFQLDPAFHGGENAQAAYLTQSMPALALAGAGQVFVTLRDAGGGQYASEGILGGAGPPASAFRRKPAWLAVLDAARRWPWLAFRPQYVDSRVASRALAAGRRARASSVQGRWRVTVSGRFHGPDCLGRLRLTYRVPRARPLVRTVAVASNCTYRQAVQLRLPRRARHVRSMRVSQYFLGNGQTGPGSSATITVKLKQPRVRGRHPSARAAGR